MVPSVSNAQIVLPIWLQPGDQYRLIVPNFPVRHYLNSDATIATWSVWGVDYAQTYADGWHRACNAVFYLNSDWNLDWRGQFELYDSSDQQCGKQIAPRFNRLVLLEPSEALTTLSQK